MCLGGIRLARLIATEFYTVNLALRANGLSKTCARLAPKKTATRINGQRQIKDLNILQNHWRFSKAASEQIPMSLHK